MTWGHYFTKWWFVPITTVHVETIHFCPQFLGNEGIVTDFHFGTVECRVYQTTGTA